MTENTSPTALSAAGPGWTSRYSRLAALLRTAVAMWCGAFAALVASALVVPVVSGRDLAWFAAGTALVGFCAVAVVGIRSWQSSWPRYGFAAASAAAAWLIPPEWHLSGMLALAVPIFFWLCFASKWRRARIAALLMAIPLVWVKEHDALYDAQLPLSAYLPVSLLSERKPAERVLAVGENLSRHWWEAMRFVRFVADGPCDVAIADGGVSNAMLSQIDCFSDIYRGIPYRRGVYRYLVPRLAPGGVLVMPRDELDLLPPGDWRFAPLPGALDDWVAARRGSAPVTDPEVLDKRLQERQTNDLDGFLPAGALAAMYYAPDVPKIDFVPAPEAEVPFAKWWQKLIAAALLYWGVRMVVCRRENTADAVAAWENVLTATAFTMCLLRPLAESEFATGIPPLVLFSGVGIFMLPVRLGKWPGRVLNVAGAAALAAPLVFTGTAEAWWVAWFMVMLSAAALREKIALKDSRTARRCVIAGMIAGTAMSAALLISGAGTFAAVAAVCAVFRVGPLFRTWRD